MPRTEHTVPEAAVEVQCTRYPNTVICSFGIHSLMLQRPSCYQFTPIIYIVFSLNSPDLMLHWKYYLFIQQLFQIIFPSLIQFHYFQIRFWKSFVSLVLLYLWCDLCISSAYYLLNLLGHYWKCWVLGQIKIYMSS